MPIVDIVQRTEKWHAWRKEGITASMIPVIMGMSPYMTPYELWAELVGLKEPDDLSNNYHVQRGVEQEPEARDAVETEFGKPYMPVCVEADHEPLFKASLDGLYKKGTEKEVLEIKCPCEKIYLEILELKGAAPTFQMYVAQVQWQLNCSGANTGRLYFYLRGKKPISTLIRLNDAFIEKAERAAVDFWKRVQSNHAPEMIAGRDKVVYDTPISNTDKTWLARVEQFKEKSAHLSELKRKTDAVKADLKQLEAYFTEQIPDDVQTFVKDGIRATRVVKAGSVDHSKLISMLELEMNVIIPSTFIDDSRREGSTYFRITIQDGSEVNADVPIEQYIPNAEIEPETLAVATTTPASYAIPAAFKRTVVPEPKSEPKKEAVESECIKPLPISNFFECSTQKMFF